MTAPPITDEMFRRWQRATRECADAIEHGDEAKFTRWAKCRKAIWNEVWGHLMAEATSTLRAHARCYCRASDPEHECVTP